MSSPKRPEDMNDLEDRAHRALFAAGKTPAIQLAIAMQQMPPDLALMHHALKNGAPADTVIWRGAPALHVAVAMRSENAVRLLLQYDAPLSDVDRDGRTALGLAYHMSFDEGARLIARAGGHTGYGDPSLGDMPQGRRDMALLAAIRKGAAADMQRAIANGANPNGGIQDGADVVTFLDLAVRTCDPAKVSALLAGGADIERPSAHGASIFSILWDMEGRHLLTPDWRRIEDMLFAAAPPALFRRRADEMTLDDLRRPAPSSGRDSLLRYLLICTKTDYVLECIARSPDDFLTAKDLLPKVPTAPRIFLLDVGDHDSFAKLLTTKVWQSRMGEIEKLKDGLGVYFIRRHQAALDQLFQDMQKHRINRLAVQGLRHVRRPRP